jgi:LCP family protein required for cell wall assembly
MKFNLLKTEEEKLYSVAEKNFSPPEGKKKSIAKILGYIFVFILTIVILFTSQILISGQDSNSWLMKLPVISQIKRLVESADKELKGEEIGRINILLLGMGGKNHDGGFLTDTIILASLDVAEKKVALLSIPRDLSIPMEGMGGRKINNVNAFAEAESKGSGGLATAQAVSDILNMPIDYYVRLDFAGFINIINELGGIEVDVENTLIDYKYPIMGREEALPYESRFEHLRIAKGRQKMDGELALKYARSRHAEGVEGSDFGRSRRQQKVLEAVKEKILLKHTLFKPVMIGNIIQELNEHLSTNLKIWEMVKLWNMFKDAKEKNIITKTLDNSDGGLLIDTVSQEGAYVLLPRGGDFAEIQYLVNNIFSSAPEDSKKQVVTEKTSLEILNGTWINGLANRVALDLEKYGFDIARISNYSRQNLQKSVIYDLTYGEKIESLKILKEKTNADVNLGLPEWLIQELANSLSKEKNVKQPDFILILGQDADASSSGTENIY